MGRHMDRINKWIASSDATYFFLGCSQLHLPHCDLATPRDVCPLLRLIRYIYINIYIFIFIYVYTFPGCAQLHLPHCDLAPPNHVRPLLQRHLRRLAERRLQRVRQDIRGGD